ncbi:MAG TPA: 6-bladed beta-propeller [Gemmatimonadaceae bacterium]|nr:6-bladed beta-propeller [Gemmatimonadaceae bacterium]
MSRSFAFAFLLLGAVAAGACDSAGSRAGAKVVRDTLPNGAVRLRYASLAPPAAEPLAFDLRIGTLDGDPNETFGDVRSIEADDDGTIYVLDHQASEVRVFDADGRFLRTLTRKGQGPGELAAANGMILARDRTLWIQDHGQWRMIGVNLAGEEVARFPMHVLSYGYVWNGTLDDRGRFWKPVTHSDAPPVFPPEPGLNERSARAYLKWFDPATETTDSVFLGEVTHRFHVTRIGGGWMNRGIPFSPQPMTLVDPGGGFWTTSGETYRIARLDERGDTLLVLEVAEAPAPVTSEDRQRFIDEIVERSPDQRRAAEELAGLAPETKPIVDQLNLDDVGRLWVRRHAAEDENPLYDLFSRDGEYLGSVRLGFRPARHLPPRIRDGKLYALATDDLGVHTVVRANLPSLPGTDR